jgi:hypothetical protein
MQRARAIQVKAMVLTPPMAATMQNVAGQLAPFYLLSEHFTAKRAPLKGKSMSSRTVPYINGYDYGVGVDTPSGDVRDVAVTGDKSGIPDAGGSIVTFDMTQVSTVSELNDVLGISASASGGVGLFSGSARFKFSKERQVNDSSVFLIVTVQVINPFQQIKAPGITKPASDLLGDGQTQKFQDEFGDMFVRGLVTGGLFFGVIEVQTHDLDEKTKVSASLKASYAAFSADGTFDTNFHQTLQTHQTTVRCYIEGGQTTPIPTQVDTMINFAANWPDTVKNKAVPYSAVLDSYSILPVPAEPNFIDLQHQRDVLIQCSLLRDQDLQVLNNIDYIVSHPDQFIDPEKFPLSQLRNDLDADLNTIAAAASNALDHPKEAALPQLKLTGPIELPKRKAASPPPEVHPFLPIAPITASHIELPNVLGRTFEDAKRLLQSLGLHFVEIEHSGSGGVVVGQDPAPGTIVNSSRIIRLTLS